jgi:hypothetical protein
LGHEGANPFDMIADLKHEDRLGRFRIEKQRSLHLQVSSAYCSLSDTTDNKGRERAGLKIDR